LTPLLGHTIYLINLASPDGTLYKKSRSAFLDEMDRAEALGLDFLVTHPGAHRGSGEENGLKRIAAALSWLHQKRPKCKVRILLETTAGQGTALCGRLEHLAYLVQNTEMGDRLGICLDTCHMFAAGYDIKSPTGYRITLRQIDRLIGLARIEAIHLNDAKTPCGSHVDRHEHIGKGTLGTGTFRRIVNDPTFARLPMIIETPKTDRRGKPMDAVNLQLLRSLSKQ